MYPIRDTIFELCTRKEIRVSLRHSIINNKNEVTSTPGVYNDWARKGNHKLTRDFVNKINQ